MFKPGLFFALIFCLGLLPGLAQTQETTEPDPSAGGSEEASDGAADAGRAAVQAASDVLAAKGATDSMEETLSTKDLFAALTDPTISTQELDLRALPLTMEELKSLADTWLEISKGMTTAVVAEQLAIQQAEAAGETVSRDRLTELIAHRNKAFDNMSSVVKSYAAKGGDEAEVARYRAYRSAIFVEEKQGADFSTLLTQATNWILDREGGMQLGLRIAVIIGSLVGLMIVARIVRRTVHNALGRVPDLSKLLQSFLVMVIYWITIAIGLMIVLSALGIDITPIFALVGGASFIIAFAMQDTLGNLAAGLMIMFNRPFDEGDYVTVAGTGGTVNSVSIVSTTVITPDNQVIVIPNSKVWGDVITNVTASDTRRVDLVAGIGYGDSIEQAQAVLEQVISAHPLTLEDPAPLVRVSNLGASSVDFVVRPWSKVEDYWTVYWDLTRQIKEAFDREGISIPFPQTDMHVHFATPPTDQAQAPFTPPKPQMAERSRGFDKGDDGPDEAEEGGETT